RWRSGPAAAAGRRSAPAPPPGCGTAWDRSPPRPPAQRRAEWHRRAGARRPARPARRPPGRVLRGPRPARRRPLERAAPAASPRLAALAPRSPGSPGPGGEAAPARWSVGRRSWPARPDERVIAIGEADGVREPGNPAWIDVERDAAEPDVRGGQPEPD